MRSSSKPQINAVLVGERGHKVGIFTRLALLLLSNEFYPHFKTSKLRLGHRDEHISLTCWPLNAIGVDLNSQNEQKGAGVHRQAVLVHFKCAGEIISFTP